MELWIDHVTVIPMTERGKIIKDGRIHIDEGKIVGIADESSLGKR